MKPYVQKFGVAVACLAVSTAALAIDSLKVMVPANPGGGWDSTGRALVAAMTSAGSIKNAQIDNKGGAAGTIGLAQFVNSSKGDGSAIMIGGMVMVGGIIQNKSAVGLDQVTPLARLTEEYEVIVVPKDSPIKDMKDLVAKFKANPGSISWGGGSAGGTDHILAGLIAQNVGRRDHAVLNNQYLPKRIAHQKHQRDGQHHLHTRIQHLIDANSR